MSMISTQRPVLTTQNNADRAQQLDTVRMKDATIIALNNHSDMMGIMDLTHVIGPV